LNQKYNLTASINADLRTDNEFKTCFTGRYMSPDNPINPVTVCYCQRRKSQVPGRADQFVRMGSSFKE
jgi:hypothetical protein